MDWYSDFKILQTVYLSCLGLEDVQDIGGNLNTERFSFLDPSLSDTSFFEIAGAFPWAIDEPNDENGIQNAVV